MKHVYFFLFTLLVLSNIQAQDYMGLHTSNFAGLQRLGTQPASIADSRYKFQLNLISVSAYASNSYYSIPNADLQNFDLEFDRLIRNSKSTDRGGMVSTEVMAPMSFMLTMSPKHALAISLRQRNMINIEGISPETTDFLDEIIDTDNFVIDQGQTFDIENMYFQVHSWAEANLTYARVLVDADEKFIKAGATLKLLDGLASGYVFFNQVKYTGLADDRVDVAALDVASGYSDNIDNIIDGDDFEYSSMDNFGTGLDLGVVYEYRPNMDKYRYTMDGEELIRRDKNKYKYKVGFSILDLGGIKYNKSQNSGNVSGNTENLDVNNLDGDVDEILEDIFNLERGGEYKMGLPTRLLGEFDYNVSGGFYMNFTSQLALKGGSANKEKSKYLTTLSLTPRVESRKFGLALPISYDKFANLNAGVSLRMGPIVVGTRDGISNFVLGKDPKSADIHFGLRFGLMYKKKKDKDNDSVSNKKDRCPQVPGVWAFQGCPDRDGDGTQDSEDACADVAGLKELQGCPDTDGDGIRDKDDKCPDVAGLAEFNGCPDTDSDGIIDSEDECPEIAGDIKFNGCPDTDGDGVKDEDDLCPNLAGSIEKKGCPDSDGDGIFDNDDKCPNLAGPIENEGCPYADSDGDGIIDKEDDCILIPGVVENRGCPEIKEEEQEILNTAFSNLEFETGKSKIATSSYTSLVELANLLKAKPDWRLKISGHTDSVGKRASNMKLSKERAQAVADFLTAQGIEAQRFTVNGFGPDNPIADNKTKEGREKNRRVELEVVFE